MKVKIMGLNIIIVDDNETFRKGIIFYLINMLKHKVVAEFSDGVDFLTTNNTSDADIILMDIEMPRLNGVETLKEYLWINKGIKAIAITSYEDELYLTELIGAGFKGCVLKRNIYEELALAISQVMDNKLYYPGNIKI